MGTPQFLYPLDVRVLRSRTLTRRPSYQLIAPFSYRSEVGTCQIDVPAGTITDFASVPAVPMLWGMFGDVANYPAVIHDWIYKCCGQVPGVNFYIPRHLADLIFEEAMALDTVIGIVHDPAVPWLPREAMYQAVRLFGRYKDEA